MAASNRSLRPDGNSTAPLGVRRRSRTRSTAFSRSPLPRTVSWRGPNDSCGQIFKVGETCGHREWQMSRSQDYGASQNFLRYVLSNGVVRSEGPPPRERKNYGVGKVSRRCRFNAVRGVPRRGYGVAPAAPRWPSSPRRPSTLGSTWPSISPAIDAFSAIPQYQTLVNGSSTPAQISVRPALTALASLSGIPAFVNFANGGGLAALVPYAALSGLNSFATGNIAGIDALSTLGASSLGDLASVSAIPVFVGPNGVLTGGGVDASAVMPH